MSTPEKWARVTRALTDVEPARQAWTDHPGPDTGRALHDALTDAAAAVHALYNPNRHPTETGCTRHPTGPVDRAGIDSGEGPCLRCNQERRRARAVADGSAGRRLMDGIPPQPHRD
ncbi:hypothetical protein DY218_27155 [Streptomyces triticagri]|uniref:Uncharacterized protein n=1 Tax=Streptomyces triticagri TaxID=2293568 RepID=A0A372LYG1_9ACTN|nr:hypothetical protein DY218_27155 [Streptomyces triticagri]